MINDEIKAELMGTFGKELIKYGEWDVQGCEVGMDILENTRSLISLILDDYMIYLTDEQLEKAYDNEMNRGEVVTPYTYLYHLLYSKNNEGTKIFDRRNKKLETEVRTAIYIAYTLYSVGVYQ